MEMGAICGTGRVPVRSVRENQSCKVIPLDLFGSVAENLVLRGRPARKATKDLGVPTRRRLMAQRPIMFRGPPFGFVVEYLAKDEGFLSDAGAILRVPAERVESLASALREFDGFLDHTTLSQIVERTLQSDDEPSKVAQVLRLLDRYLRESDETLAKSMVLLKAALIKHAKGLEEQQRGTLGERLESLLATPNGFARQHKAERLAEATGAELSDLQIICDVRPVFNEERTEIEGALPVSTLRLDLEERDGRSSGLEIRLTEEQIADLSVKAESALRKVILIKKMLGDKEIVLPKTRATVDQEEPK